MPSMSKKTLGYWVLTAITAFAMFSGGIMNASAGEEIVATFRALGYPAFLPVLLGVWKILAGVALVAPGFPRIKEWAYAGIGFAMTGAFVSHVAVGDPAGKAIAPLVVLAFAVGSYVLRPLSRRLVAPAMETTGHAVPAGIPSRA